MKLKKSIWEGEVYLALPPSLGVIIIKVFWWVERAGAIASLAHPSGKKPPRFCDGGLLCEMRPGTELFCRGATPKVSSPLQRFTAEFGMESEWVHRASGTRKAFGLTEP